MDDMKVKEVCDTAALWWGEKVGGGGSHHDNGDRTGASGLAGIFADLLSEHVSDEKTLLFSEILSKKFMEYYHTGRETIIVDCDYAPCGILSDAAKEAGIKASNFPWKTSMHIRYNDGEVLVKNGYGAPWKTIYPKGEN